MPLSPGRHLVAQVRLDVAGELLEIGAGCPAAAGARRNLRQERAEAKRLQNCWATATSSVRSPSGSGVMETRIVSQSPRQEVARGRLTRPRCPSCPCPPRSGPGAARSRLEPQAPIDVDEIAHARNLGRQDDSIVRQAGRLGQLGRSDRALHHGVDHDARASRGSDCRALESINSARTS